MKGAAANVYRCRSLVFLLPLLLAAGCDGGGLIRQNPDGSGGTDSASASSPIRNSSQGRLGPVEYGFDPRHLIRAEVDLALPPAYELTAWAVKLIPVERAELLGEDGCTYGQSGLRETCTAAKEVGLSLSLLERPLRDYRSAFAEGGIPAEEMEPTAMFGEEGFSFTAQAEGSGIHYRFVPVGERTLLIARRFAAGIEVGDAAIEAALASLELYS